MKDSIGSTEPDLPLGTYAPKTSVANRRQAYISLTTIHRRTRVLAFAVMAGLALLSPTVRAEPHAAPETAKTPPPNADTSPKKSASSTTDASPKAASATSDSKTEADRTRPIPNKTALIALADHVVARAGLAATHASRGLRQARRGTAPNAVVACFDDHLTRLHVAQRFAERSRDRLLAAIESGDARAAQTQTTRLEHLDQRIGRLAVEVGGACRSGSASKLARGMPKSGTTVVAHKPRLPPPPRLAWDTR